MSLQPGDTVLYEARLTKNNVGVIRDVGLTTVTMIDETTVDKKLVLRLLKPVPIPGNPSMANTVIVFSVDVTSSMGRCFDNVKAAIAGIDAIPEGVGIILQVFTEEGAKCLAGCISFGDDLAAFKQYVSDMLLTYVGLERGTGGDGPENHIYAMFQLKDYLKFYPEVETVFTFVFTDAGVHYNSVPSSEARAETKALKEQFGVSVTDAYARLALLLDQPYKQTVMFMACTQSPDPWLAHLAKATEGLTLLCSGNLTDDLQRLIDSLFTITQGGTIGTVGFTSMTPHTITNKLPANEKVADHKIQLQEATWDTMFEQFERLVPGKKFQKRLRVRGAGEATALVHLILGAENAATSAEESDTLAQVIHLFDPADQPFVEAAWHALVQAFKDGVRPEDTMCEITFATLREQLQEMKDLPNDKAFAQLGQLVSGIMANLRFMKRPDGSLDLANAWCLSIDPKKVGTSVVTLATFGSLQVYDGYRKDPTSRHPCNIVVPWCPKNASAIFKAIFRLLCACRFLDTVTTGILTGGTDCFPSMHPGMVICLAWALMTGDSERDTTLVDDAFDMLRRYPRPLSRTLHDLFDKGQGSPEPSPQQLLASFLWWAQKKHVVEMPPSIMTELVQAFAMVNARYEEEFDWASLVDVSDFNPLLGAHPVEGEFTLCPVAWMETLPATNLFEKARRLVDVLERNGIRAAFDIGLIAQCLLLDARTAWYALTAEKVHVPKTMPPLAVLLGAKVAEAVRRKFSPKWAAAREAHAEANLVEQVVAAVEASDSVPVLAAKLKEISFLPPWARGIKKVSRAHLALLFDKLVGDQLDGDKLKLAVMAFALDDSWTTESVLMLKSLSSNIVAVLGELKDSFTARMSVRVACKRQEIAEGVTPDGTKIHPVPSNRHGHSTTKPPASVLNDAPPLRNRFHIPPDAFIRMLVVARAEVKEIRRTPLSPAATAKMEEFLYKNECDVTSFQAPRAPAPVRGRPVTPPLSRAGRYLKALQALDLACEAYAKLDATPQMTKMQVYNFFETPMEAITRSSSVASLERRAKFWAERR